MCICYCFVLVAKNNKMKQSLNQVDKGSMYIIVKVLSEIQRQSKIKQEPCYDTL